MVTVTILASEAPASATSPLTDEQDQLMHALAVAETIASLLPVAPFDLDINNYTVAFGGRHGVRAMLPPDTQNFGRVQDQLGGVMTLEIDASGPGEVRRRVLSGTYFGVPFQVSAVQNAVAPASLPRVMEEYIREGHDPDLSHWIPEDYAAFVATHPELVTA